MNKLDLYLSDTVVGLYCVLSVFAAEQLQDMLTDKSVKDEFEADLGALGGLSGTP